MAVPTTRIYLRSPYFVSHSEAGLDKIQIDIYIYTGTLTTDKPASPQYELESTAFLNEAGTENFAEADIAELARDYVEVNYDGTDLSNAVWIEYELKKIVSGTETSLGTSKLTGLDGYGYFEDGYNPDPSDHLLMSGNYVVVPTDGSIKIPVLQDNLTGFSIYDDLTGVSPLHTVSGLAPVEETDEVVQYISITTGLTVGEIPKRIVFSFGGGISDKTVFIQFQDECKYDAVKATFVNRFGALQALYFFGKSSLSINTSKETFKRNLLTGGTYDAKRHQKAILTKNGVTSVQINTGFYPEESNPTFNELMLSEAVWADVLSGWLDNNAFLSTTVVAPVHVQETGFQYKTSLNDKLINYGFNMEFASDRINSVR